MRFRKGYDLSHLVNVLGDSPGQVSVKLFLKLTDQTERLMRDGGRKEVGVWTRKNPTLATETLRVPMTVREALFQVTESLDLDTIASFLTFLKKYWAYGDRVPSFTAFRTREKTLRRDPLQEALRELPIESALSRLDPYPALKKRLFVSMRHLLGKYRDATGEWHSDFLSELERVFHTLRLHGIFLPEDHPWRRLLSATQEQTGPVHIPQKTELFFLEEVSSTSTSLREKAREKLHRLRPLRLSPQGRRAGFEDRMLSIIERYEDLHQDRYLEALRFDLSALLYDAKSNQIDLPSSWVRVYKEITSLVEEHEAHS